MAEKRPDLAALPFKNPGYLSPQLAPSLWRLVRQGVFYWSDIQADASAQTGRTAGAAPTATTIADAKTSFNLENDEFIKRLKVPAETITGLGGLDRAQQVAARKGKRSVFESIEDLTVANVLDGSGVTEADILASLIEAVETAKDTVMDYADGNAKIVMVCSTTIFGMIKRYDEVVERMQFTGIIAKDVLDVRGISAMQLAATLNLDGVLVGPKTAWYDHSSTYQDRAAIIALPDAGLEPIEELQFARTLAFLPDGGNPENFFQVETYYSDDLKSEIVDVQAYAEQHLLNPELCYVLKGIDEENATTTTTTTT